MRIGVFAAGMLLAASWPVEAVTLRSSAAAVAAGRSRKELKKAILPDECSHCQGSGVVDPFQGTHEYCQENLGQCKCCKDAVEQAKASICLTGKQGGTFMGYGSCVEGIKAAIDEKKAQCEHQQAVDDYNKDQQKEEINDILGEDSPYNLAAVNKTNSTGYVPDRFSSECASYSDPTCADVDSMCAHGYGCNYVLQVAERDLSTVKDYYGMYQNTPCFR